MNSFEINKIITAILVTILLVFGIGKISDIIFDKDDKNIVAYKVEAPEGTPGEANAAGTSINLNALFAVADVAHGEKVFKKCKACHSINASGGNKIGPKLWNVMFRPVGSIADYKYSKAMASYGKEWNWEEINGFLIKPAKLPAFLSITPHRAGPILFFPPFLMLWHALHFLKTVLP